MASKGKFFTFFYRNCTVCQICDFKELWKHCNSFCTCHDLGFRIFVCKFFDASGMIRFQMRYNQIIRCSSIQHPLQILFPFVCLSRINRIHNCDLLVQDHIRVVGYPARNWKYIFKQRQSSVTGSNPNDILSHFSYVVHSVPPSVRQSAVSYSTCLV